MEKEIIEQLASIFGESGNYVLSEYVKWFIASSIVWVLVGIILIYSSVKVNFPEDWDVHPLVIKMVLFAVGILIIGCNFADIIAPQGIALHQLITDIRGH